MCKMKVPSLTQSLATGEEGKVWADLVEFMLGEPPFVEENERGLTLKDSDRPTAPLVHQKVITLAPDSDISALTWSDALIKSPLLDLPRQSQVAKALSVYKDILRFMDQHPLGRILAHFQEN